MSSATSIHDHCKITLRCSISASSKPAPIPFGRKFQVMFKWLQTAISLRHADTMDVKFILVDEAGGRTEKTIALPHPGVTRAAAETGREVDDPWCARLAELHLLRLVETRRGHGKGPGHRLPRGPRALRRRIGALGAPKRAWAERVVRSAALRAIAPRRPARVR